MIFEREAARSASRQLVGQWYHGVRRGNSATRIMKEEFPTKLHRAAISYNYDHQRIIDTIYKGTYYRENLQKLSKPSHSEPNRQSRSQEPAGTAG